MLCCQIPPNLQLNWILKDSTEQNKSSSLREKYRITSIGWKWLLFDFVTGGQEIKIPLLVKP